MAKLLLLSVLFVMVAAPLVASRARTPQRGMKAALILFLAFNTFYVVAVLGYHLHFELRMSPARAFPGFFAR